MVAVAVTERAPGGTDTTSVWGFGALPLAREMPNDTVSQPNATIPPAHSQ